MKGLRGPSDALRRLASSSRTLRAFDIGGANRPHPRKITTGEDSHFYTQDTVPGTATLGVADGVGGAADSAWYSANLMSHAEELSRAGWLEPHKILEQAWALSRTQHELDGRSTACVVMLDDRGDAPVLHAANLGDSGFCVLRPRADGRMGIAQKLRMQQHSYNCPFQLGWLHGVEINTPADADVSAVALQQGDVVVAATDGLWDAMHVLEIIETVVGALQRGGSASAVASALVDTADELSRDPMRLSPAVEAMARQDLVARPREAQDDVTVVVAKVP